MKKIYILIVMLTQLFLVESSYAQYCNNAASNLAITPTTTDQISPIYASGRRAFRFDATAGCTYYFETCGLSTQDTYLRLYSTGTGGTVLATGDDNCGTQSSITWTCVTSGTYSILLTRYLCSNLSASNTQLRYRITSCGGTPYNPCTTIPTIAGCGTSASATMTGTGAGWSVTSCGWATPGQERLFQFTAPTTGTYTLNVSAITGGYVDFFWKPASGGCNATGWNCIDDIFGTGVYSAITPMTFTAGTTYYILLDPEGTGTYNTTFNLVCPAPAVANDLVCNATAISCGQTLNGTTVGANNAGTGENLTCGTGQTMPGVWYVVPGNGQIMTASLCGTVWDSKISVFNGTNCAALTCVGGNDDAGPACATASASFSWTSVVGQNYYILVHGFSTNQAFSLALTCTAPPPADPTGITSSNASICAGTNVTLTATGASGTVYWFTGTCATTGQIATGNSIVVSPTATTTYFARNYNGSAFSNNCASFTLTVNPLPTINAGTGGTICAGNNIQLNASSTSQTNGTLSTTFAGGNGCGAGNMFDLVAGPAPVTVNGFSLNPNVTGAQTVNVYYRAGTHVGNTTNIAAWTLLGAYTLNGTAATASYMATGNIVIPAGATYGIYVQYNANYTDGNGTNQTYSNANLTLNAGVGHCTGFDGCCAPRIFNGIVHYTVGGATPTISWSPSASLSSSSILNPVATPATTTTYTVTATANGCSASSNVTVTIEAASTAPTSITGGGNYCPGNNVTLTPVGGILGTGATYQWFAGGCNTAVIGTNSPLSVAPIGTTDYFLRISATSSGACPATACVSTSVTLPTAGTTISNNNESATCPVNDLTYVHFYNSSGRLLASINSNGQNLGNVSVTSYVPGAPIDVPACNNSSANWISTAMGRHWVITPQFQPTTPVSVRLPYSQAEFIAFQTEANANLNTTDDIASPINIKLTKYSGPLNVDSNPLNNCIANGGNGDATDHQQTTNGLVNSYLTGFDATVNFATFSVNSFSEFWLYGSTIDSPLPAEYDEMKVSCFTNENKVEISWITLSESNTLKFEVERTTDYTHWTVVGEKSAAGNSSTPIQYTIYDESAINEVYYRLKQIDQNGEANYYPMGSTNCSDLGLIRVFPNPTNGELTLRSNIVEDGEYEIRVTNTIGILVHLESTHFEKGINDYSLDFSHFAKGIYSIELNSANERKIVRFVKQ